MVEIRPRCRVYILGMRLHHGLTGAALTALGCALMLHDRRDWPWRIRETN